ncbi:3-deoxy-7-phosphoheptulonate synthase [Mesoterricola sediminis]|uniref:3-deoxy-7-phosphoheptulonate synthase n=1 Tax=Mesoterricola sediminis TaxID=2927980 RepID=A0AA48GVY6_9BACT|nr:3-deoxy-7-phosphoheptulonate synthase [Mesoterricola sediminis]BDU76645.1 3-deoxy-7-phosphoheptulonate synthase [Mesoterricola sediminis]
MLILMEQGATDAQVRAVMDLLEGAGIKAIVQASPAATSILAPHASQALKADRIEPMDGVSRVVPITSPYKLASSDAAPGRTIVDVRGVKVGGKALALIAGPCGVESREQLFTVARYVAESGARLLRAGAFKPRTSPYAFQGMGVEALELLDEARREFDLGIVTEATEVETFDEVERVADLIQIGARNMQNFALLRRAGRSGKPVLLKRGTAATLEEWLYAAEYVLSEGNRNVILCERGIRTWSAHARNTLDVSVIPAAKALTHLPVIADPSHATGRRDLVVPCARAAVAAGADGILVETHCQPSCALSDGPQALLPLDFIQMVGQVTAIRELLVRETPGETYCF